jgi:phage-related protein
VPGALPPRPAPVPVPTPPPEAPGTGVSGALSSLTEVVGSTTMAFSLASGAVLGLVQAFSPATVQQFMMALNDLAAVVGSALAPVLQGLTTIAREVGAVLLPVAEQLQPVFMQLTQTVLQVLLPVIDNWASVLQAMVPLVAFMGDEFSNLGTFARVFSTVMAGMIEQVKQWVAAIMPSTGVFKGFTDGLRDAIEGIAKAALLLVGYFAKLMGATGFLEGMLKSLGKAPGKPGMAETKDAGGFAAAQQARFTTAMDFGKSVATAAFTATGGIEGPKDTNAWLKDVVKELEDIKAGRDNAVDKTIRAVKQMLEDLGRDAQRYVEAKWPELVAAIKGEALSSAKHAAGFAATTGAPAPYLLKKLFGLGG